MHDNIMTAGSRDRPLMHATRRYAQWKSHFMRYVDTKANNIALKKCILQGDDIYLTFDSCSTTKVIWITIERLKQDKEIVKPITPPPELVSEEDSDPEQAQRDKEKQKNLALIAKYFKKIYQPTNNNLKTSSNTRNKNVDTSPWKPKQEQDYTYHKEKMLMCKQAEKDVPLRAEQSDWLDDTDEDIDEQELKAHYSFMAKIQEVVSAESGFDVEPLEKVDSNDIPDSSVMYDNDTQADQNVEECDDEPLALAGQLRSTQMKEKVVHNNSQVKFKKKEVEDHHKISNISNKIKSLTACNDSLKFRTSNVNVVCATCGKCMVRFRNYQFSPILSYGDLVQGNLTINRVYYVEGLNYNLFSIGQFCDEDLKVAFQKSTCFVIDLQGNDLLFAQVITVHTERGTEFLNKTLYAYYKEDGIEHQTSTPRTPEQNGIVKRWNHYDNSGLVHQLQETYVQNSIELRIPDHSNEPLSSKLVPNVFPSANTDATSLQELDLLSNPFNDEFFTAGNQSVPKPSALFDNSSTHDTQPTENVQTTIVPITPTTTVTAEENIIDIQVKNAQIDKNEFYSIFRTQRNKADLDTMIIDYLYNNFNIIEQEVKRTFSLSSSSRSPNMAFLSSPSSNNKVNTVSIQVSAASIPVNTVSSPDNTVNLSDATVYAFQANQPNGS
uniref:Integrase, catalytic region, zinc finger, CCHC-type, peptidase aspartic, catalytic n=1 Tax=Tanacetum cinerariifolium TaxID=118510 RepID=A0A6L2KCT1_TANCI|nr:integrase, catalytic region, zinc finger, CCHC-type, peptidase aspartic, catalytic [Tanacetum cinerariifolium]